MPRKIGIEFYRDYVEKGYSYLLSAVEEDTHATRSMQMGFTSHILAADIQCRTNGYPEIDTRYEKYDAATTCFVDILCMAKEQGHEDLLPQAVDMLIRGTGWMPDNIIYSTIKENVSAGEIKCAGYNSNA